MSREKLLQGLERPLLQDIYTRNTSISFAEHFDPKIPNQMLNIQIRNSIKDVSMLKGDSGQKILRVAIDVGVRFTDVNKNQKAQDDANATGEDDLKVEILGLFIADYLIVRDDIAGNVLEEFAKSDALFAVWPYWREFVNSACLRARLPALVLPLPAIGEQPSNSPN